MVRIKWDEDTKRLFEAGVDRGVLYPKNLSASGYKKGVGWNGLTKVSHSPEGGDATPKYANNNTYLNILSKEKFKGNINAYTYPDEFAACNGEKSVLQKDGSTPIGARVTGQTREPFGLTYRTLIGNDTQGLDHGYYIHLLYNATVGVTNSDFETLNENPDAIEFSWPVNALPAPISLPGFKPSAHILIDSRTTNAEKLKALENVLYGTDSSEPRLPEPDEVFTLLGLTQ